MKKLSVLFIAAMVFLTIATPPATADDGNVGYSIESHIPANQIDKRQTYFNLLMEPNQQQELTLTVRNSTDEETDIKVAVNNPVTNRNGVVDYTIEDAETDESLEVPISEIATVEEEIVTVPANGSKNVTVLLDMPEKEFDGVKLGGIYFEKVLDEEEQKEGVQIQNKYAYVVGLMLSENETVIEPELHLKSVEPTLVNYRTAISASIQNSEPVIVKGLAVNATVLNEEGEELTKIEKTGLSMAPNTTMDFPIDWENNEFEPGVYTVQIEAIIGEQTWEWEEKFVVEADVSEELNSEAVEPKEDEQTNVNGGYSVIILVLLGIIFWLLRKNRKIAAN